MNTPLQQDVDFLEHVGVKGMRWGVRKAESSGASNSSGNAYPLTERDVMILQEDVDFLSHYGVKGMQWGVRKDKKWASKRDSTSSRSSHSSRNTHEIAKAANKAMRSDIRTLNKSSKYNTKEAKKAIKDDRGYYNGRNPTSIRYKKDVSDIYMKHVKAVAPQYLQTSPSGKWQESLVIGANHWDVQVKRVDFEHSNISDPDISMRVRPIMNEDGYIVDIEILTDELEQSSFNVDDFIEHHGVKGMRWGVRNKSKTSETGSSGTKKLSRREKKAKVKQEVHVARQKKASALLDSALKDPEILITLNRRQIVTGKEFVDYLSRGGLLDVDGSQIFAQKETKSGPYIQRP